MLRLLLLYAVLQCVLCSCPSGFELVRDGQCRGSYGMMSVNCGSAYNTVVSKCKEVHGTPIIIHDEEQQSYWMNWREASGSVPTYAFTIGIGCNSKTQRYEWSDGSPIDYRPRSYNSLLDNECKPNRDWLLFANGTWASFTDKDDNCSVSSHIFCITQLQPPTGDGCDSFNDDTDDGICYQVKGNGQSWQDAQNTCRNLGGAVASVHNQQENQFLRKLAVVQGAVNGIYIGATSSGKGNQFGWIDGSPWDYQNFYPGFPITGKGDCLAMDTFSNSGEWMNMDCSSKMGVACAKKAEPRHECTAGPWKEGQVIYSPGYPYDASEPCDYFISVAAGKKVRVEVLLLEANTCCDRLVMEDNVLAGNLVANLTGEISDKYYTTQSSNFMRVSWQPNGGVNVRGMMFSFTAV